MHAPAPDRPPRRWDDDEMDRVVDRYGPSLLRYATRMTGDPSVAHDAVQETYLRMIRADPNEIRDRLAAWLFTVCRTRVIDCMRGCRNTQPLPEQTMRDPSPGVFDGMVADEQQTILRRTIEQLPPRQREVLMLRLEAGLSYREIAEVTAMKIGNVSFHMHAAVTSLKKRMAVTP